MKKIAYLQTCGMYGMVTLSIEGDLPECISDKIVKDCTYDILPTLYDNIIHKVMSDDVKLAENHEKILNELLELFGDRLIYSKKIDNQYDKQGYYSTLKWLQVTTTKGVIIIGWRKRVISIDWSGIDNKQTAETLFPNEDVTKEDYLIHAWSLEKAKEYIDAILSEK